MPISFGWQYLISFGLVLSVQIGLSLSSTYYKHTWNHEIQMPGVVSKKEENYMTAQFPVLNSTDTVFVTGIIPKPNHTYVHHMILRGCSQRVDEIKVNSDSVENHMCSTMIYAWAHAAPELHFPPGVGLAVGLGSAIKGFELEVHFNSPVLLPDHSGLVLTMTNVAQPRHVGVFLLASDDAIIGPGLKNFTIDISCRLPIGSSMTLMAMRTHAHTLGREIIGYRMRQSDSEVMLLGRGNPQWPQAFYSLRDLQAQFNSIDLHEGDVLFARCVYDSTGRNRSTRIGATHNDEMCNLYMMYHANPSDLIPGEDSFCVDNEFPDVTRTIMDEDMATAVLPTNAPLIVSDSISSLLGNANGRPTPTVGAIEALHIEGMQIGQLSSVATIDHPSGSDGDLLVLHRGQNAWTSSSFDAHFRFRHSLSPLTVNPMLHVAINGINGKVKQSWGSGLFVLPHSVTLVHNSATGEPTAVFITDVALHQVFKFTWGNWHTPALVLGTRGEPGVSAGHFCQPADVTVSSTGDIFVADGYCNSRIVKFSSDGKYLTEWSTIGVWRRVKRTARRMPSSYAPISREQDYHTPSGRFRASDSPRFPGTRDERDGEPEDISVTDRIAEEDTGENFVVVHSVTVIPPETGRSEEICATNRNIGQIVCFTLNGHRVAAYAGSAMLPTVFALDYSTKHRLLFAIVNADFDPQNEVQSHGVLINPVRPPLDQPNVKTTLGLDESASFAGFFNLPADSNPHDLTVSSNGRALYVTGLGPVGLYRCSIYFPDDAESVVVNRELKNVAQVSMLTAAHRLVSARLTGAQVAGLIMLTLLVIFIALIVCIRMCWCGRRDSRAAENLQQSRSRKPPSRATHWSGRPSNAKQVGFQLLNQNGEEYDDPEVDSDEEETEDVILRRDRKPYALRATSPISLQVNADAERPGQRKPLSQLARSRPETDRKESNGDLMHSMA